MSLLFANPSGFWALLGVPLVILIHCLQRRSISVPSSTLFLLKAANRRSKTGRRLERLRHSLPLWLQILSVVVLTWLLVEPRWSHTSSIHKIVIVADSSASMEPFKESTKTSIALELPDLLKFPGQKIFTLMESHPQGQRLYRGNSLSDLTRTIENWEPSNGAHSPEAALRLGRSLAGREGTLIFLTDHVRESLPFGAQLLSVGQPIENVGFSGIDLPVSEPKNQGIRRWHATVRNYSDQPQEREWRLSVDGSQSESRRINLEPGESRILAGSFPDDNDHLSISLSPDDFTRDDQLFLVAPESKPLSAAVRVSNRSGDLVKSLIGSLQSTSVFVPESDASSDQSPDLTFAGYNPLSPTELPKIGIIFIDQEHVPGDFLNGPVVSSNHSLVEDLNWQGLIARSTASLPPSETDVPLVWQGERGLILMRTTGASRQLIFNFDIVHSNAARLPAFVILVDRFITQIRQEKIGLVRENLDLDQSIKPPVEASNNVPELTMVANESATKFPMSRASFLRAPGKPGFFKLLQGDRLLFDGTANFADVREADFSSAAQRSDLATVPQQAVERHTKPDPFQRGWVGLLILISLLSWFWQARPTGEASPSH